MAFFSSLSRRSLAQPVRYLFARTMTSSEAEVILEKVEDKGVITLNRPKAYNALNLAMIKKILPELQKWEQNIEMSMVLIKGQGDKAFCAGGDIRVIAEEALKGGDTLRKEFFGEEYRLNNQIATLGIPYVAIIDGITMGGGVGLSVHSQFRVATERTVFAMPETAIGFFPDVGGSYFLSRLPGELGTYLGLTGFRLTGRDNFKAGIATHFVATHQLKNVESDLMRLRKPTISDIDNVLTKYQEQAEVDFKKEFVLKHHMGKINNLFQGQSVEEIVDKLRKEGSEWSSKQLEIIGRLSPTSLKVTHQLLQKGKKLTLQECLKMEYRLSQRIVAHHDFYEGVRAVILEKDNNPKWDPASLEQVTKEKVDSFFQNLDGDELRL